jgi:hypothetical protein
VKYTTTLLVAFVLLCSGFRASAQTTSTTLRIDTLPKGTFVIIADVYDKDPHFKKKKNFVGDTIYLLSEAIIDAKGWYAGSIDLDGVYEDYFYFSFLPVAGQQYEPQQQVTTPISDEFRQGPLAFDAAAINKFLNELYQAYRDSFTLVTGSYVNFSKGYTTSLQFPGAMENSLSAIDPSLGYYAYIGDYTNEQDGYAAYTALLEAIRQVKVYPDIYSDAYFFPSMGAAKAFESGENLYSNVGFLMQDIGAIINVPGDDSVIMEVTLTTNFKDGYFLTFEFYNKMLAGF